MRSGCCSSASLSLTVLNFLIKFILFAHEILYFLAQVQEMELLSQKAGDEVLPGVSTITILLN